MSQQMRKRLLIVAATHLLAGAAIAVLYRKLGQPIGLFGLAAVLAGAFNFGLRGALASWSTQAVIRSAARSSGF